MKPVFKPLVADEAAPDQKRGNLATLRARRAAADTERALVIVNTGDGKGKSTAAFGLLARMLGHGQRCVVVQFLKTGDAATERRLRGPLLRWHRAGTGFTWESLDRAGDEEAIRAGWEIARRAMDDPEVRLLLLDEINLALLCGYLEVDEVLAALRARQPGQHVVLTGRGAPRALVEAADIVTEMREVKHAFRTGVRAQPGIEY